MDIFCVRSESLFVYFSNSQSLNDSPYTLVQKHALRIVTFAAQNHAPHTPSLHNAPHVSIYA